MHYATPAPEMAEPPWPVPPLATDLLHVERAAARGRLHGTRFATIEAQRLWLAQLANHTCRVHLVSPTLRLDAVDRVP